MPQLVKKRRSGWAVLAAGALVASLFAVGAAPAASAPVMAGDDNEAKPGNESDFSACVGPATDDSVFTDLGTLEAAVPGINCLAYYGITMGKTATTFDPNSNVTRSEMALFLYRAASLMGVDLMGGDMDMMVDYGDIDMLGEDRQNAITALARNGILAGRSDMAFEPGADITRAEMAVALVALLDHTPGAPVHKNDAGLYELGMSAETAVEPNDYFTDARASVPRSMDNAISAAYELGITSGVGDGSSFGPDWFVPRRDMATFITRALGHSNLRPAGLTAQVHDATKVTVSVRDGDFAPVVNQTIDIFRAPVADTDRAFKADGTCSGRAQLFEGTGRTGVCEIDGADPVTQTNGDAELTFAGAVGDGQTVWVWHGDLGDKVGSGTDLYEVSIEKGSAPPVPPASAAITSDLPKGDGTADVDRVHFGRTVTLTVQLKGGNGDADKDAAPKYADNPPKYTVVVTTHNTPYNTDGSVPATDATNQLSQRTSEVTIGADGSATVTVTAIDSDTKMRGQVQSVVVTATGDANSDGTNEAAVRYGDVSGRLIFSDEAPRVEYVSVESSDNQVAPGAGSTARNAVTVTVRDQYGDPVNNAGIVLSSSNLNTGDGDGGATIRSTALRTGRGGTVRISYSYTGGSYVETLRASWDGAVDSDGDGDLDANHTAGVAAVGTECQDEDECGETTVNWVSATELVARTTAVSVLSLDADNDQVVVDIGGNTPTSINYDSNDVFMVIRVVDGSDATDPVSLAGFEEALAEALKKYADDSTNLQRPDLVWSSYIHDESSDIASFTLDVTLD